MNVHISLIEADHRVAEIAHRLGLVIRRADVTQGEEHER